MIRVKVEDIEPLIQEHRGNVAAIARKLNVSRGTIWNRMMESPNLKAALDDAREGMIDEAESQLYLNVIGGDTTALIFFLKTQGRRRGYSEKMETFNQNFTIDLDKLTDEQLDRIAKGEDVLSVIRG